MALIELHPINREALRDDPVAVHGEQTPAMMRGVVAAALSRHPKAAAHGRAELQWLLGPERDATDHAWELYGFPARWGAGGAHNEMLENLGQVRFPLHQDVEPDDRRTGRGEQRRR